MYLVYKPEGQEEPKRWKYQPKKLMSPEREMLERYTGRNFTEFTIDVQKGNSKCRRALLYMYQKREHPTLKFDDVDFAWDELTLEHSKGELLLMRENVADSVPQDQLAAVLEKLDEEIAQAYEDPAEEGKAQLPIAD
jgi:spore cortex formation protein SpoVR/YcgB (stage V sporulation)